MRIHHATLPLAGYTLQQIDFDPATFQPEDLLWLPYHASLSGWGRKRQAEHLAGRIAAVYALREVGEKQPPAIGDRRQPLWPAPWFGSISHCGNTAIAIVARCPVGIDIEAVFPPQLADELASHIASEEELAVLRLSTLIVAVIRASMLYLGIEATQQQMLFGLVLIAAIALTIDRSKLRTVK